MILGTCSICGGRVIVPDIWHGIIPPEPTCETCGGVKASHGPVIEMKPAPRRQQTWITDGTGYFELPTYPGTGGKP